jgi:hypothetical protein
MKFVAVDPYLTEIRFKLTLLIATSSIKFIRGLREHYVDIRCVVCSLFRCTKGETTLKFCLAVGAT